MTQSAAPPSLDVLTAMPDREAFYRRTNEALKLLGKRGTSVAVLYVDLDNFKAVNSLHGRKVGDQLLQSASRRLTETAGDSAMVGRVGGDEFACLVLGVADPVQLESPARRILKSLSAAVTIDAFELTLDPSIGIVFCTRPDTEATAMLQWAASAMYRARHEKSGFAFNNYQKHRALQPAFHFGSRTG